MEKWRKERGKALVSQGHRYFSCQCGVTLLQVPIAYEASTGIIANSLMTS